MKRIIASTAAIAALAFAGTAAAQTTQSVQVNGNAEKQCGLGNQSGGGTGGYTSSVDLGDITDANGQLDASKSAVIGFGNVWCNSPASLTMAVSSLSTPTVVRDSSSFVNAVDMVVDGQTNTGGSIFVYFGQTTSARTGANATNNIPQEFETGVGRFSQARVTLALPAGTAGNDRPVAGAYTGTVTLTVQPQA